ncbi:hypothetical protein C4565_00580 [Candidatus Parcubacteria bacterium]|nr:MAG: hypothetical protein C4565_00580 [Candidatus Parcubacteria bacterium]
MALINGQWAPANGLFWTRDEVKEMLVMSPAAVEKGILRLYELQTFDEQASGDTKHHNGVGFSGSNAKPGTYFAECIQKSDRPVGKRLWGRGLERCRQICLRHSGQLTKVANKEL